MAIGGPEASDDTSLATVAQRRMAQARLCCFARNDGVAGRGRKLRPAVVAQALEAKPAFGQIRPLKRPFGAVELRSGNGADGGRPAATSRICDDAHRRFLSRPAKICPFRPFLRPQGDRHTECRVCRRDMALPGPSAAPGNISASPATIRAAHAHRCNMRRRGRSLPSLFGFRLTAMTKFRPARDPVRMDRAPPPCLQRARRR